MALPHSILHINAVPNGPLSILISDLTTYPIIGHSSLSFGRNKLALIFFASSDEWDSVDIFDQTNQSSWVYDASTIGTFNFWVFAIGLWTQISDYTAGTKGCIIFHTDGYCYKQVGNTVIGSPTADTTNWKRVDVGYNVGGGVLTILGVFEEFYKSIVYPNNFDITDGQASATLYPFAMVQVGGTLTKLDCHLYEVTWKGAVLVSAEIFTYGGTKVDDITFTDYTGGVAISADGVYIIKLVIDDGAYERTLYLPLYDFCDANACFVALFKYVNCKCSDPCDPDCSDREKLDQRRNDMVLVRGLLEDIKSKIYIEKTKFISQFAIDQEREEFIEDIGRSIDLLTQVTARCGTCADQTNDTEC